MIPESIIEKNMIHHPDGAAAAIAGSGDADSVLGGVPALLGRLF